MDDPLTTASTLAVAPASLGQRQLWLYDRLYGRDGTYNIPFGLRLRGLLDGDALRRSLNEIVRRHEVLRTTFTQEGGELLQVIADELAVPLPVIACDEQGLDAALDAARRQIAADGGAPFDLELGPLLRARLYRLAPDDHVLTIVIHHAVFDGWSIGTLQTELGAFYSAFAAARPALLPDLPIQFADF